MILVLVTLPLQQGWLRPLEQAGLPAVLLTVLTSWSGPLLLGLAVFCWSRIRPFRPPDWLLMSLIVVALVPLLWQFDRLSGLAIGYRYTLLATAGYWIGRAGLLEAGQLDRWLKIIIRCLVATAVLQLLAWAVLPQSAWSALGFGEQFMAGGWQRVYGAMSGPNQLATFLSLGGLWLIWRRQIGWVELAILATIVLLTFSRSALLGLVGGVIVTSVALETNWRRRGYLVAIGALIAVAIGLIIVNNEALRTSFIEARNADIRIDILQDTVERFRQSSPLELVVGHGAGTAGPAAAALDEGGFIPENWFLQIAYEFGLLGVGSVLGFLTWFFVRAVRAGRPEVAAIVVCIAINSLFLHPLSDNFAAAVWFFVLLGSNVAALSGRVKHGMISR